MRKKVERVLKSVGKGFGGFVKSAGCEGRSKKGLGQRGFVQERESKRTKRKRERKRN